MSITRRDWWLGLFVVAFAILAHATLPRYEWRASMAHPDVALRIDRWRGTALRVSPVVDRSAIEPLSIAAETAQRRAVAARQLAQLVDAALQTAHVSNAELARLEIATAEKDAAASDAEAISDELLTTLNRLRATVSR